MLPEDFAFVLLWRRIF